MTASSFTHTSVSLRPHLSSHENFSSYASSIREGTLYYYILAFRSWWRFLNDQHVHVFSPTITSSDLLLRYLHFRAFGPSVSRPRHLLSLCVAAIRFVYKMFSSPVVINLEDEAIDRVIKGLKIRATLRPATTTTSFDVSILFQKLAIMQCLTFSYDKLCELAPAVLMGSLPSRPAELSSLTFGDITILWPADPARAPSPLCEFLSSLPLADGDATTSYISSLFRKEFTFDLLLRGAKNDYLRDGLPKPLVHHAGHVFSPALFLIIYAIRHAQKFLKQKGTSISLTSSFFSWSSDASKKLSVDSISNRVTKVAREFLGVRTVITARSWRVAAANALIDAGISIERVAKLGGWRDVETLSQHYIRWRPMSHQQWLATSGAPQKRSPSPPPISPLSSSAPLPSLPSSTLSSSSSSLSSPQLRRSNRERHTPARFEE